MLRYTPVLMPPPQHTAAVLAVIARYRGGATIQQIESAMPAPPSRRTLQRWLNGLIEVGRVQRNGRARATRYQAISIVDTEFRSGGSSRMIAEAEAGIPLSTQGRYVENQVRKPITRRRPVEYDAGFMGSYRPNETFYLAESVRAELWEMAKGQAGHADVAAGTYAQQLAQRLLIDLAWNSSRLEGNTYSLLETARLLSAGEAAAGKPPFEAQMILNHKEAIRFLIDSAHEIRFDRHTLCSLHALLSDNLLPDPGAGGRIRSIAVGIYDSTFVPLEGPQRIEAEFDALLATTAAIHDPFEQAFFVMVHLPYLQPFDDVNKRTSRLAANIPLIRANLCPLSFVDVPQHVYISATLGVYELNRVELLRDVFIWAYKRSCARYSAVRQSLGEPDPLRMRYREQIREAVGGVVRERMNKAQAIDHVHGYAARQVASADQPRFIEVVETELLQLHSGNIARFRLRPGEFAAWQEGW